MFHNCFPVGPALVTTKDAGDAITLLQSLAGSTFDSSQLVLTACMGYSTVTEARLQELREKHRPSVLVVVEERSKGGRVSNSKGLASKLYSFKHEPEPLIEENKKSEELDDAHVDGDMSQMEPSPSDLDQMLSGLTVNSELEGRDPQDQVAPSSLVTQISPTPLPTYKLTDKTTHQCIFILSL